MSPIALAHRFHPQPPAPGKLVIVLHGRGDSMQGFTWLPEMLQLPGVGYLFLNAPDPYYEGYSWYDLPPNQGPGILRSRQALVDVLDELVACGWQSEDLWLFGFSQGCLMALDVGARYDRKLGGICGVSGYVYFTEDLATAVQPHAREIPWWVSAGAQDDVVPAALTAAGVEALTAAGIPVAWQTYAKGHTIDPVRELPDIRTWLMRHLGPRI